MFNVGDLVFLKQDSNLCSKYMGKTPAIVISLGPLKKFITIYIDGKEIAVQPSWIEKYTMEGKCLE